MQRGTWLVERRFSDKSKDVTRHSGVSYACLPVPVVRHSPPRARASALCKGRYPPARVASCMVCDSHLCLMPLRDTDFHAHSGYINIVHYLFQASRVVRCILPFRLDVQQVSV